MGLDFCFKFCKIGKSFEEIEEDEQALRQIVAKARFGPWQRYVGRQKELLDLEKKEGFPAFSEYAKHITETLNRKNCTLLVKRGHDNLSFIRGRFLERQIPLRFGAIVFEGGFYSHSLEETENVLSREGYKLLMRYGREADDLEYTIPYALGPGRNCAIFVPNSGR